MDSDESSLVEANEALTSFMRSTEEPERVDALMGLGDTQVDQQCPWYACRYGATRHDSTIYNESNYYYPNDFDFGISDFDLFGDPPLTDVAPLPNDPFSVVEPFLTGDSLMTDDFLLTDNSLLTAEFVLGERPLLTKNVPEPEFPFEDLVNLDLEATTECAVRKHEILTSHATPPVKYHEFAKQLDEGVHHLLLMIGVERRYMDHRKENDTGRHYRPLPWSNHMERIVAHCEQLKDDAKFLREHNRGDYGVLCQTVDIVSSKLNPLPDLTWGILSDSLDEEGQIVEGRRDYKYLHDMRAEIIRMRHHPNYKSAKAKGARVMGRKWVRKQGGKRLVSK
ncbi:hypothetical protein MMC32_004287 [Xylographa parallela]|nr:hypothetical protein [Xylographa parallela]